MLNTLTRSLWLICIIVCCAFIVISGSKGFQFNSDILSLLPTNQNSENERIANQSLSQSSNRKILFLVSANNRQTSETSATVVESLLRGSSVLEDIQGRVTAQQLQSLQTSLKRFEYFHLTDQDYKRLSDTSNTLIVEQALSRLYSPMSAVIAKDLYSDPLQLFFNWQSSITPTSNFEISNDWLSREKDGRIYHLISAELTTSPFDLNTQKSIAALISDIEQQITEDSRLLTSGIIFHAAYGAKQAQFEISTIGLGSILAIFILLIVVFRRLSLVLLTFLPIVVGCTVAFGLTLLAFERVHLITLAFGAGLIGVAIDYSLHYICAALGHSTETGSQVKSQKSVLKTILPSLILGLLSSIVAYAAQGMTPFPGLRQMAFFSATGLVSAWITVVLILPAFKFYPVDWIDQSLTPLFRRLKEIWPNTRNKKYSLFLGLLLLLSLFQLTRIEINDDIRNLQTSPRSLIEREIEVLSLVNPPSFSQYLVLSANSSEQLLQLEESLQPQLEKMKQSNFLSDYQSVAKHVYSLEKQIRQNRLLTERVYAPQQRLNDISLALQAPIIEQQANKIFKLSKNHAMTVEQWLYEPASQAQRHLWLGKHDDRFYSLITFTDLSQDAVTRLEGFNNDEVLYVDRLKSISNVLTQYRSQLLIWIIAAYTFILFLLCFKYQLQAWRIIAAPALASIFTIALLSALGAHITLFNLLALLIVLGIGLDASIFLFDSKGNSHTWLAVNLSTFTTLFAFGLLGLCQTPILHYFGITILLGIFLIWLLAPSFTIIGRNHETH